jgi:hypothetical protein
MIAVITGDIMNSRVGATSKWLDNLKAVLSQYGKEPKQWEIYRGDSFQLSLPPETAFNAAIHIKAAIKLSSDHDVRMAIGLGDENSSAAKITESNGQAYVRSGDGFEALKKNTLHIQTGDSDLDEALNIMIGLAMLVANNWTSTAAKAIVTTLEHTSKPQKEIAALLKKSQSSVSESLKRSGFDEIMQLNDYYKAQIARL